MIYLKLFLTFLEIGAVSFGGGYGMISLIREKVLENAWLTDGELLNFIAVAESTPGPIAVNMATFVGSSRGGFLGALCATSAVVLPSFIIILIIASIMKNLLKYKGVNAFLSGVRPCVVGLIIATSIIMLILKLMGISTLEDTFSFDAFAVIIFVLVALTSFFFKKVRKKNISPIVLIVISALLGTVFYYFTA